MEKMLCYSSDYNSLKEAEKKYKQQKKNFTNFMEEWKNSTKKYLTFSAKGQRVKESPACWASTDYQNIKQTPTFSRYLQQAEEENRIGLNKKNSFNRDKYGKRPTGHTYCLMGDLLYPDKLSSVTNVSRSRRIMSPPPPTPPPMSTTRSYVSETNSYDQPHHWRKRQNERTTLPLVNPSTSIHGAANLPMNIKHRYGSAICDELLSNENLVAETLSEIERKNNRERRGSNIFIQNNDGIEGHRVPSAIQIQPCYKELSNILRQNIFPGESITYTCGTSHNDYSNDVYRAQPLPSKYNRRRYLQY